MPTALLDPLRSVRRAIASEAGSVAIDTADWEELSEWLAADHAGEARVVVSLITELDHQRLATLTAENPDAVFVALLDQPESIDYAKAFRSGAVGACPRDSEPEEVVKVAEAARQGWSMLPAHISLELARTIRLSEPVTGIDPEEVMWIRALAEGTTVSALAQRVGYSEREMFRLLGHLYRRMGVANRTEALVTAARWGLLEESPIA